MIKSSKLHLPVLSVLFLVLSVFLFLKFGVKNVNDSHRYLDYATNLSNGFYFEDHNFWYISYSFFIFLVRFISGSSNEINLIVSQIALSYFSMLLLYKATDNFFNNKAAAFVSALLYLIFIEILTWNFYILSESFYVSLTCFSLYFLSKYLKGKRSLLIWILGSLTVFITILAKPTGIALLAGIIGIVVFNAFKYISKPIFKYSFGFTLTIFLLVLVNKMLETFLIMENYSIGEVVYAISTLPYRAEYASLFVSVPENLDFPSIHYQPLLKIIYFIVFNLKYWITLFLTKIFFYLVHVRPFWSIQHNLFNIAVLLPVYYYSIKSLISSIRSDELKIFSITYFSIHVLSVGITTVDWDGRFLMPVLPLLFVLCSNEIAKDFEKLFSRFKRSEHVTSEI